MGRSEATDLPDGASEIFAARGLSRSNGLEWSREISVFAHAIALTMSGGSDSGAIRRASGANNEPRANATRLCPRRNGRHVSIALRRSYLAALSRFSNVEWKTLRRADAASNHRQPGGWVR